MIREAHTSDREQILKFAYAMWQEAEGWVPADLSTKADINAVTQYVDSIFASKSKKNSSFCSGQRLYRSGMRAAEQKWRDNSMCLTRVAAAVEAEC